MSNDKKKGGGYKNPPHHSRWKPGQSGNPKGRPKKDRSLHSISNEHLHEIIINAGLMPMDYMEKGQKKSSTKLHLILTQLTTKAAGGDMRATKLYIQLMAASTTTKDKIRHEWILEWTKMKDKILEVQNKKGTLQFFNVMFEYYMFKKNMRVIEGGGWPWEPEEPVTTADWVVFNNAHEALQQGRAQQVAWPLKYPSDGG